VQCDVIVMWIACEAVGGSLTSPVSNGSRAVHYLPFLSTCTQLVKGDSCPEICSQRNAEDGGFPLSGVATGFLSTGAVYILFRMRDENEIKRNK
jgi:hypothetical protein